MTITELLQGSRDAHQRYRENVPHRVQAGTSTVVIPGDAEIAGQALVQACSLRSEAHTLDPGHGDPAWQDEMPTYDNDALLAFYASQLTA